MLTAENVLEEVKESLGRDLWNLLMSDGWTDIMVNDDGSVWIDTDKMRPASCYVTEEGLESAAMVLAAYTASKYNSEEAQSLVAVIPIVNIRCSFISPPAVAHTTVSFRKPSKTLILPEKLVEGGVVTQSQLDYLRSKVLEHRNILISGATGSGKTTIMNSMMTMIDPDDRLYVVQDIDELVFNHKNRVKVKTNPKHSYADAIADALRQNPSRVIIGECRFSDQAYSMLQAWNTGHPGGLATIHADNAKDVLLRLDELCKDDPRTNGMSQMAMIKRTIHVTLQMEREGVKRRAVQIWDVQEDRFIE